MNLAFLAILVASVVATDSDWQRESKLVTQFRCLRSAVMVAMARNPRVSESLAQPPLQLAHLNAVRGATAQFGDLNGADRARKVQWLVSLLSSFDASYTLRLFGSIENEIELLVLRNRFETLSLESELLEAQASPAQASSAQESRRLLEAWQSVEWRFLQHRPNSANQITSLRPGVVAALENQTVKAVAELLESGDSTRLVNLLDTFVARFSQKLFRRLVSQGFQVLQQAIRTLPNVAPVSLQRELTALAAEIRRRELAAIDPRSRLNGWLGRA